MAENPKDFLLRLRLGIGKPVVGGSGLEHISFEDAVASPCVLAEMLHQNGTMLILEPKVHGSGIRLDRSKAVALANSLNRWARTGKFEAR